MDVGSNEGSLEHPQLDIVTPLSELADPPQTPPPAAVTIHCTVENIQPPVVITSSHHQSSTSQGRRRPGHGEHDHGHHRAWSGQPTVLGDDADN